MIVRNALLTLVAALLPVAALAEDREVSGSLAYPQRIALPPDALLVVQLTDAAGGLLAEARQPTGGAQVPLPFAIAAPEGTDASLRAGVIEGVDAIWLSDAVAVPSGQGPLALGDIRLAPVAPLGLPARLRCGDTDIYAATGPDRAQMRLGGRRIGLAPVVSASGAKYEDPADATTVLWSKGRDAFVTVAGAGLPDCVTLLPDGAPFTARGNEPGWNLELAGGRMRLGRIGEAMTEAGLPPPEATADGRRFVLPDGGPTIDIDDRTCRDTATGMPYPHEVHVTLGSVILSGCGGAPADLLTGVTLVVADIGGSAVPADAEVTLRFLPDGRVAGKSACNRYNAGYAISGEGIAFSGGALTRMACPEPLMALEQQFHETLARVSRFDIADDGAVMLFEGDTPVLLARP